MPVREFKELRVYQQAYDAATEIFAELGRTYDRICGGLVSMMKDPSPWYGPDKRVRESTVLYES